MDKQSSQENWNWGDLDLSFALDSHPHKNTHAVILSW